MLHCASTAKVVRPLAFDAGVLPDSATGVGVAQIHGVVCERSSTGPPLGLLVIVSPAQDRSSSSPLASATNRLLPTRRRVSTPRRVRASASATNPAPTLRPLSVSFTSFIGTFLGTCTSTSASPSLIRSARFDKVLISKLDGGESCSDRRRAWVPACADFVGAGAPAPQPATKTASVAVAMLPNRTVKPEWMFILVPLSAMGCPHA